MRVAGFLLGLYASVAAAGDLWMSLTPYDAAVGHSVLASDPFAPDTLYADTNNLRGVAKSTDAGKTWTVLSLNTSLVKKVIVGPDASQHVTVLSSDGTGYSIYRSSDGGLSWDRHRFSVPGGGLIWDFAVDPHDWNTIYTAQWRICWSSCTPDSGGVSKSVDGGSHWFAVLKDMDVNQILIDPFSHALYAITSVVYRSNDGGTTWTSNFLPGDQIHRATLDPVVPDVLYASTLNLDAFWRSDDGGRHWQKLSSPFAWGTAWSIAVSPTDRNTIVVGGGNNDSGAARSVDGGKTWQSVREGLVVPDYPMQIDWIRVLIASNGRVYGSAGFLGAMTLVKTPDGRRRAVAH